MSSIPLINRIDFNPTDEQMQSWSTILDGLDGSLLTQLMNLSVDVRRTLPKAGPKTLEFIKDALAYALANPQFLQTFNDINEFSRDVAAIDKLTALLLAFSRIKKALEDSLTMCRSQAYSVALGYYNGAQQGVKQKQPGAEAIVAGLSPRFPGRPKKGSVAARRAANGAADPETKA